MEYILATFRAKTETLNFANLLKSYGIACSVVSTPRAINISCGISAKFSPSNLTPAKAILARRRFDSFGGFYLVTDNGLKMSAKRV